METLLVAILILGGFYLIYRKVLGAKSPILPSFNFGRARTSARSATGGNAMLMLAAVNLANLGYTIIKTTSTTKLQPDVAAWIVVICIIGGVILLVVDHSVGQALIGAVGYGAALAAAGIAYGVDGVVAILVLSIIALWLLGFVRGILG